MERLRREGEERGREEGRRGGGEEGERGRGEQRSDITVYSSDSKIPRFNMVRKQPHIHPQLSMIQRIPV